ncbi:hypothetical protein D3C76_854690 [compost metagenome]
MLLDEVAARGDEVDDQQVIFAAQVARQAEDFLLQLGVTLAVDVDETSVLHQSVEDDAEQQLGVMGDQAVVSDVEVMRVIDLDALARCLAGSRHFPHLGPAIELGRAALLAHLGQHHHDAAPHQLANGVGGHGMGFFAAILPAGKHPPQVVTRGLRPAPVTRGHGPDRLDALLNHPQHRSLLAIGRAHAVADPDAAHFHPATRSQHLGMLGLRLTGASGAQHQLVGA